MLTRHEDLVLVLLICVSKNIGTLDSLREETENVVDDENGTLRTARASDVCLHAIARALVRQVYRLLDRTDPYMVIHSPFSLYPLDTTGGTVQQA